MTSAKVIVSLQDEQDVVFYEQVSNVLSKKHISVWTKLVAIMKKKTNLWNTKLWQLVTINVHLSGASEWSWSQRTIPAGVGQQNAIGKQGFRVFWTHLAIQTITNGCLTNLKTTGLANWSRRH